MEKRGPPIHYAEGYGGDLKRLAVAEEDDGLNVEEIAADFRDQPTQDMEVAVIPQPFIPKPYRRRRGRRSAISYMDFLSGGLRKTTPSRRRKVYKKSRYVAKRPRRVSRPVVRASCSCSGHHSAKRSVPRKRKYYRSKFRR